MPGGCATEPQVTGTAAPAAPARPVLAALMLVLLLAALDQTIVSTGLPTIVGELGGLSHLSWVVTSYLLASTIVTPIYGKLGDLYGRKIVLQTAIVVFLAGSAFCGMSRTMAELIGFRFVQGVGGGGLMVTVIAAVRDLIPPRDRGRYPGLFGAGLGGTRLAGPPPPMLGLFALARVLTAACAVAEANAREPILPPLLFADPIFVVSCAIGFVVGLALFGSVTYLPLYLQVVHSASPTSSGLQLAPMMGGVLLTSIVCGQFISRSGRYRPFPIAGTALMTAGLPLLLRAPCRARSGHLLLLPLVVGIGLGLGL